MIKAIGHSIKVAKHLGSIVLQTIFEGDEGFMPHYSVLLGLKEAEKLIIDLNALVKRGE